ncbi:MoaD/ThiS family protein [Zeaxanthinibacter enoshimensis]|uniref:Molybdopterin synthase sulfur carrier subunit n=1 Tax=Zeaxanthinibacter enoshimensis TaxID=392009 RepID=A0A4R6TNQ2_9FLAO|nr:MoaD/ThiS family protein [Zeaxanthinibacter enoshimensis]TDQ31399.1 molybdopterin synthase sulfur carrier subunit [Zeaxanthinibacter enoshimensis]
MTVLLFGITRDIVGTGALEMPADKVRDMLTVGDLRSYMEDSYPALRNLSSLMVAVNNSYAEDDIKLDNFDEIALIPPVSGG